MQSTLKHCAHHAASTCPAEHQTFSDQSLYLFVPQWLYHNTARTFTQFSADSANLSDQYLTLLELIGYLANRANQLTPGSCAVTLQHVTDVKGNRTCGYLLQASVVKQMCGTATLESLFHELLHNNRERDEEKTKDGKPKKKKVVPTFAFERLTLTKWRRIMMAHDPSKLDGMPGSRAGEEEEQGNLYKLIETLSLDVACGEMAQCQDPPCHPHYYERNDGRFPFPFPARTYHISQVDDLAPANLSRRIFPWVPKPQRRNDRAKARYIQLKTPANLAPDPRCRTDEEREADLLEQQQKSEQRLAAFFEEMFNTCPTTEKEFDVHEMRAKVLEDKNQIPAIVAKRLQEERDQYQLEEMKGGEDEEEDDERWEKRRIELMREELFRVREDNIRLFDSHIFTDDPTAAVADSIKAIRKWELDRLDSHKNFCMPRPKVTSDLSFGMETQMLFSVMLEVLVGVNTVHTQIILVELAGKQVYQRTQFHNHVLLAGPPRAGKTYTLEVMFKFWIDGTARMYTYSTPKAKTSATRAFDSMIEIFEEVAPTMLGINNNRNGSPSACTDAEAIMKSLLTTGKMSFSAMTIVDGVRTPLDLTIDCCSVFMGACNNFAEQIPAAVRSRFDLHSVSIKERLDNGGIVGAKMRSENKSDEARRSYEKARDRVRRDQAMAARVGYMIYCGLLPEVNMSVANVILANVLEKGKHAHLCGIGDVRNLERVVMLTKTIAISDAINVVFDSCVSPLTDSDFKSSNLFLLEKHLKANVDHVVYALGLLEHQYENKMMYQVVKAMGRLAFAEEMEVAAYRQNEYLGHAPTTLFTPPPTSRSTREMLFRFDFDNVVNASTEDQAVERLGRALHGTMSPQPAEGDIRGILRDLMHLQITLEDGTTIPALQFKIEELKVKGNSRDADKIVKVMTMAAPVRLFETNRENKLKDVITQVLCHPFARERIILYPQSHESLPYIHQTIHQQPDENAKQLVAAEPLYMDAALNTFNRSFLDGVDASLKEDKFQPDIKVFYKLNDELDVDCDLDDWGTECINERLGLTQAEVDFVPSHNPAIQFMQIKEATENADTLRPYHNSFRRLRMLPEEFEAARSKRRRENAWEYSMYESIREGARRRAGTAFNTYSIPEEREFHDDHDEDSALLARLEISVGG